MGLFRRERGCNGIRTATSLSLNLPIHALLALFDILPVERRHVPHSEWHLIYLSSMQHQALCCNFVLHLLCVILDTGRVFSRHCAHTFNGGLPVCLGHLLPQLCSLDVLGKGFEVCSSCSSLSFNRCSSPSSCSSPPVVERKKSCYV